MIGLTNESDNALPLDKSLWEHIEHMGYSVGIEVSENKSLDILYALHDIYEVIDTNPEEAKECILALACILVATSTGNGDNVWTEVTVQQNTKDMDLKLKEMLNEEPR